MKIYAIGDLHLPGGADKSMEVFGAHWEGHFARIAQDWRERVQDDDVVLIPGDISWAMQMDDALPDLRAIGDLPGKKVLLRGNHDYWWGGITRLRESLPPGMFAVQNDALRICDTAICGSRGWTLPNAASTAEDEKIYARELTRMEMSLDRARKLGCKRLIAMCHYPPLEEGGVPTPMSRLLTQYGADDVVYGHLHGPSLRGAVTGAIDGVRYHCVSCDGLRFRLYALPDASVADETNPGAEKGDLSQ